MTELIVEIQKCIENYRIMVERRKKYHELPFTRDTDHYYSLIMLINTLETWERCLEFVLRLNKRRFYPINTFRSNEFNKIITAESKSILKINKNMKIEMIEYMKTLEWKIEELDGQLKQLIK
jgi:hypothetical protein